MEREISGYYYDGKKSYILYRDEDGNETMEEWKDEQSGQDKYSTEIVIQGYNSSLTMLGGGNSGGGIANDNSQASNNTEDLSQVQNDMDDDIPF